MLLEPVALSDFFLSFFSAAMIILTATIYAALYAWGKIRSRRGFYLGAGIAYLALLISVAVFSQVNHLVGHWLWLSATMALGYGLMPMLIWNLCVASHDDPPD